MTQPVPSAADLVQAVRELLEAEIGPALEGRARYQVRVAANVLAVVERELRDGPAADAREHARLVHLLGQDGPLEELVVALATALRAGRFDLDDPELVAHLVATAADGVAVANPRYADPPAP